MNEKILHVLQFELNYVIFILIIYTKHVLNLNCKILNLCGNGICGFSLLSHRIGGNKVEIVIRIYLFFCAILQKKQNGHVMKMKRYASMAKCSHFQCAVNVLAVMLCFDNHKTRLDSAIETCVRQSALLTFAKAVDINLYKLDVGDMML